MAISSKKSKAEDFAEQIRKDKISQELMELEIDAKYEIERFQRYNPKKSTEEILFNMAKYLVQIQAKYKKQEEFFMAVFGSAIIGSILGAFFNLFSGNWTDFMWCVIVLIISISLIIYLYGEKRN